MLEPLSADEIAEAAKERAKKYGKGRKQTKHFEEELEGVRVVGFRLPAVLRRWWIGAEELGGKPIEWL